MRSNSRPIKWIDTTSNVIAIISNTANILCKASDFLFKTHLIPSLQLQLRMYKLASLAIMIALPYSTIHIVNSLKENLISLESIRLTILSHFATFIAHVTLVWVSFFLTDNNSIGYCMLGATGAIGTYIVTEYRKRKTIIIDYFYVSLFCLAYTLLSYYLIIGTLPWEKN